MGKRQDNLRNIVFKRFNEFINNKLNADHIANFYNAKIISKVYVDLDGQLTDLPTRFGPWDISTKEFIIELDEERHFNRYRLTTLKSEIYIPIVGFSPDNYRDYCIHYENNCLKSAGWGGNWKNNSTEKMFCQSDPDGTFVRNGSSRWRQRAYYDFLKDLTSQLINVPLIRISIYDQFNGLSVGYILNSNNTDLINKIIDDKVKQHCT